MRARHYRTQLGILRLMAILGGVGGAIAGAMFAHDGDQSWLVLPLWALGSALLFPLVCAPIAWQRMVLDERAGLLRYHNIGSLHRWRQVRLGDVLEVRYDNFADKRKAMVSGLYLHMRNGARPPRHRLMDNEVGRYQGPSTMFRDVAAAVRRAQPRAMIDPILLLAARHPAPGSTPPS